MKGVGSGTGTRSNSKNDRAPGLDAVACSGNGTRSDRNKNIAQTRCTIGWW